jgi:hypothetical protein
MKERGTSGHDQLMEGSGLTIGFDNATLNGQSKAVLILR